MKLKKGKLSRIIVAGLMVGSIGLYSNVSSAAETSYEVSNGQVVVFPQSEKDTTILTVTNVAANDDLQATKAQVAEQQTQINEAKADRDSIRGEISTEQNARTEADENLKNDLTDAYTKADDAVRGEISQEVADRTQADENLKNDLTDAYTKADDAVRGEISQEVADRAQADKVLSDTINNVSGNVDRLNSRVNSLEDRMGDVEDRIDKVGAMSAAIANLRTMGYDPEAPTEIAVGVGQYKSETGLALGIFHYPNQDFMLSASISTSGDEVMGGIGATWKIGRK